MAIPHALKARLRANGIQSGMPGWQIVDDANLSPPAMGSSALTADLPSAALQKLMQAFYNYGRNHFTWKAQTPQAAVAPGLLTGASQESACASFRDNLKWLAETGCGIQGISLQSRDGNFLTAPGSICIDSKWKGNVRTLTVDFPQFKCFRFSSHYWLALAGQNYDVCYNRVFLGDVAWTALNPPDPGAVQVSGAAAGTLYKLANPHGYPDYISRISAMGPDGWSTWRLVSRTELPLLRS